LHQPEGAEYEYEYEHEYDPEEAEHENKPRVNATVEQPRELISELPQQAPRQPTARR